MTRNGQTGRVRLIAAAVTIASGAAAPTAAYALPYEFIATYEVADSGTKIIPIEASTPIVRSIGKLTLASVGVRAKSDPFSKAAFASIRNFTIVADCGDRKSTRRSVPGSSLLGAKHGVAILDAHEIDNCTSGRGIAPFKLTVTTSPTPQALCGVEMIVRTTGKKARTDKQVKALRRVVIDQPDLGLAHSWGKNSTFNKPKETQAFRALPAPRKIVDGDGREILFSFCKELREMVDWDEMATKANDARKQKKVSPFALGRRDPKWTAKKLSQIHKTALVHAIDDRIIGLIPFGKLRLPANPWTDIKNVGLTAERSGTVYRPLLEPFTLIEQDGGGSRKLANTLDESSSVMLGYDPKLCPGCDALLDDISIVMEHTEKVSGETKKISAALSLGAPTGVCHEEYTCRQIKVGLNDNIGKTVTFRALLKLGNEKVQFLQQEVDIRNLGLITTFPGASEITAFIKQTNASDPESTSSIPISLAFPLDGGDRGVAITLPWIFSYNTRTVPDLDKYFAVFAHVSAVFESTPSGESGFQVAAGAGASVAKALHFSWAYSLNEDAQNRHYLLVGLSIPDIVKLVQ